LRLLVALVAVAGLTADLVTKIIAVTHLEPLTSVRLLGGLLTLRLIRNPGAAFSQGQRFTYVFAIAGIIVLAFVIIRPGPSRSDCCAPASPATSRIGCSVRPECSAAT
jgi:signal peptidase II